VPVCLALDRDSVSDEIHGASVKWCVDSVGGFFPRPSVS
jgi:hypothetical protein